MKETCPVCIRACTFGRSFCGRRDAKGNLIAPNSYHAVAVDLLFEKPIRRFSGNRKILSIGTWGCNLRCRGCQNARLSWTTDGAGLDPIELTPQDLIAVARRQECGGISYTFNEPAILIESVAPVAAAARAAGLANFFITNSTLTRSSVMRIGPMMDAVAADIKSLDDGFYEQYCGAAGIAGVAGKILDCIRAFRETGCHLEVRTNVIPGANDQEENFAAIAGWIRDELGSDVPWHVTRFFPAHELSDIPPTPPSTISRARRIGRRIGLKHVYSYLDKGCDCAGDAAIQGKGILFEEARRNCCCPERR